MEKCFFRVKVYSTGLVVFARKRCFVQTWRILSFWAVFTPAFARRSRRETRQKQLLTRETHPISINQTALLGAHFCDTCKKKCAADSNSHKRAHSHPPPRGGSSPFMPRQSFLRNSSACSHVKRRFPEMSRFHFAV